MKPATLVALIFCALELLMNVFTISANVFHFQFSYHTLNILFSISNILFTGGLTYFFVILYTNQKS
jgi:hypothetical protein